MSDNEENEMLRARASDEQGPVLRHVSQDAETWAWLICTRVEDVPPWMFPHDVFDTCTHCGMAVQLRPNSPKRPARVCLQCALDLVRAGRA